ncbi:MAG: DNA topoisomerase IV subunit A [Spirochaetaceae bacterium]|jgi:topoisomerase-4 subunit A|nr:DNA topoisomerase IV subunit A [Spirochaetaceae bacterium]
MAYINKLFDRNFLEYASYVIKDRAIPDLDDGLKPVQRRILHSLFEMDDGKFHKVANVVGHCMKYHPHGDASIGSALVVLANKTYFIDRQGNFGNIFTGDEAAAARYIECRATSLAKEIFYNPKLTVMADSYDGRNREPVVFPAKIPALLVMGAEGIAVGMSTKILPHNILETLAAEKACLEGKPFSLYPDFPTGGHVDVSDYKDGNGKVLVRAKLDTSDPKRIVIRELPYGSTTESLINSIETAAKAGRIKIQSINDFTTEKVEIEIRLSRGVYSQETIDALFAFTECEQSISVNLLVIKDNLPAVMTVSEVIQHHARQLIGLLTQELEIEKKELQNKFRFRNLERIFIEDGLYKSIEKMKTPEAVEKAIISGFSAYRKETGAQGVQKEDVDHLLKIPIRRLSLYDITKAKTEMKEIQNRIKIINGHLKNITDYGIAFLDGIIEKARSSEEFGYGARKTVVGAFEKVAVKEVTKRDLQLKYDTVTGYLGTAVSGAVAAEVSPFDRILTVKSGGTYFVAGVSEKTFVGPGAWWIGVADKEAVSSIVFTIIYKEPETGYPCIKRCVIEGWIMNKEYSLAPEGAVTLHVDARKEFSFTAHYAAKPRQKISEETFNAGDFTVRGLKAGGLRLADREVVSIELK